jgi:GDPmannose 4,6-dehydratase
LQTESTKKAPLSPYGISKAAAQDLCDAYVRQYNMFCSSLILYNHTSPNRNDRFFEIKVVDWILANYHNIKAGYHFNSNLDYFRSTDSKKVEKLKLGSLDSCRSFFHSKDCAQAAFLVSSLSVPSNFIVSGDKLYSMKDILSYIFGYFGLDWNNFVVLDKDLIRKKEGKRFCGSSDKIRRIGWTPSYSFESMFDEKAEALARLQELEILPQQFSLVLHVCHSVRLIKQK